MTTLEWCMLTAIACIPLGYLLSEFGMWINEKTSEGKKVKEEGKHRSDGKTVTPLSVALSSARTTCFRYRAHVMGRLYSVFNFTPHR